ncbi:PREDICTED: galactokinase-like [Papilio polytes]|uniref:galactokinase-like n=1 Tax=Papilio polytes TaxID=76194 RepID=UPI000675F34A|nr:PREDICTED: galactokinase-like [Papilio polytes]
MSNELTAKGEDCLLQEATDKFVLKFGRQPRAAASAPGRVNLIGEHVDYCEGFVLPVALPFKTVVVGDFHNTDECNIVSVLADGQELSSSFPAPTIAELKPGPPSWINYVKGVVAHFPRTVQGFNAVVVSDVPMGSGVSSSASLEVAVFTFLEALTKHEIDLVDKALLCQKAEHEFPGVPCGVMDQYVVTLAQRHHALLIDCRSLEAVQIPMVSEDIVVLVVNSSVKHQLAGSEYPQRRAQCHAAAALLALPSLRHAAPHLLKDLEAMKCDELVLKRATHVVNEISRTEETANALRNKDFKRVGELFYQSHDSLSKLMEVSCPELDELVDILRSSAGVLGARMTGGGFGGCVVALVNKENLSGVKKKILSEYNGNPVFFECQPSDGARVISYNLQE